MHGANITNRQNAGVTRYRANITNRQNECVIVYSAYIIKKTNECGARRVYYKRTKVDSRNDN